jgi:hypothetical protein
MPLNKLDNFIKNTEGRILYVSPSDLDSTDSIDNAGNSLAKPFKTLQRALIEAARFSYVKGNNNDIVEKTTILLMPGDHLIDNRPGFKIKNVSSNAKVVSPGGVETFGNITLDLNLTTNFDINQEDNVLYKFNSVEGGVIVPRGTSIVGLDLRKTKIRPKYVPNPTDNSVENSAIFRITGAGYFWQFSIFDGDESGLVYTDPQDFSVDNRSTPIFSHHKLTCFEYADGINKIDGYDLTDLDMYYAKVSNAYNTGSGSPNRNIDNKYPLNPDAFAKRRPEFEIVGAFLSDPIQISSIEAGFGGVPTNRVTVTTVTNHELNEGTPIKIDGVFPEDYNISTKVATIDPDDPKKFTYLLPRFRNNLGTPGNASGSTVTIETDTVSGASPYIFNISMRSVYGMNGMTADGSKADGFRSMVVAQFTAISLQKDDRAFVKYDKTSRSYNGISLSKVTGTELSNGSSSTNAETTYHLDDQAIYRNGWETSHIKIKNDSIMQIVSVFAIGFNKHFVCESGGDASITNSNSNFGQLSLVSDGFKTEAFDKDNKAFITHILPPRANIEEEENVDWLSLDVEVTTSVGISTHLYIRGFDTEDNPPPTLTQGYRVGAKKNDQLFLINGDDTFSANILMENGVDSSLREFNVTSVSNSLLTIGSGHGLKTGEKIYIISDDADYPENITPHIVYYVIAFNTSPNTDKIKLASTKTDADKGNSISIYGGSKLRIQSRVVDKFSGDIGHPVQFDSSQNKWFITVNSGNTIYPELSNISEVETNPTFIKRTPDGRSIDEKVFKLRIVIPKELVNAKNPEEGFIIQESSTTNARSQNDFTLSSIGLNDYKFERNHRFIAEATHSTSTSTIRTELPHNLEVGDKIIVRGVKDSTNTEGTFNSGYNGSFIVDSVTVNNMGFTYTNSNSPGTFTIPTTRDEFLPRFERNDNKSNFYVYRSEVINDYIENQQDGVYHVYVLKSNYAVPEEYTDLNYSQNVTDLYPQLDRDNINDSPVSTKSKALSSPIGEVYTSDLKGSITRETTDDVYNTLNKNLVIASSTPTSGGISTITFKRNHNFNRVLTGTLTDPSSTRTQGTYYNVKLYNSDTFIDSNWDGATAQVVVGASGSITSFQIQSQGSGYDVNSNQLYFDNTNIGGGQDSFITITTAGISTSVGDVLQVTGLSTVTDAFYRITNVVNEIKVAVAKTSGDPDIFGEQFAIHVGPSIEVSSSSFSDKVTTFTCNDSHDFYAGNKFRVIDANNNNLGDFLVKNRTGTETFTSETVTQLSGTPKYLLKHYLSSNSGVSDRSDENLSARAQTMYAGDVLRINNGGSSIGISTQRIAVEHPSAGIALSERFPIGSYVQAGDEIMRVSTSDLSNPNKLNVIRGALSTKSVDHHDNTIIRKIRPIPIEFRRPSIIRASGHTFEYLGYGPGNYSTGLPQVQTRSLTEKEEFLVQSQERSSGIVVYTGMNNKGDFYVGNTKKSSATGQETSFDTPIPTVTGEDPARLSAIFDEVTIKERIVVEGGDSGEILSQFDGPVTFNNDVRMKETLSIVGRLRLFSELQSTSSTSGALILSGGMGIAKNLFVGEALNVGTSLNVQGNSTLQSNLTANSQSTFNELVTVNDSLRINAANEEFRIRNGSNTTNQFLVDTNNGNTTINGNLTVNGTNSVANVSVSDDLTVGRNLTVIGISTFKDNINLLDNDILNFGNSQDLKIYHNGSNSFIQDTGTGSLILSSNQILINSADNSETMATFAENGSVSLRYNNTTKIATTNTGATITGTLVSDGLTIGNGEKIQLGNSNNFEQYFDGTSQTILDAVTGTIKLRSDDLVVIEDRTGNDLVSADTDAGVSLSWRGASNAGVKFQTTQTGATITGTLITDGLSLSDAESVTFGNSQDLSILHDGSNSYVRDTGNGNLILQSNQVEIRNAANNEVMATFAENGSVSLRYNNTTKIATTNDGATITGVLGVDGRADIDNVRIDDNTITTTNTNENLNLSADGTGVVRVDDNLTVTGNATINGNTTLGDESGETFDTTTINGVLDVNGPADIDDVRIEFDTITTTNTNGNLNLSADGNGVVRVDDNLTVTGNATINGTANITGSLTSDGDITADSFITTTPSFTTINSNNYYHLLRSNGAQSLITGTEVYNAINLTTKGQILVATGNKTAIKVPVGTDGTVLTADSNETAGVSWQPGVPVGSVFYVATATTPSGYLYCNGDVIPTEGALQGVSAALLQELRNLLGTTYGVFGQLPNLVDRFAGYSATPGASGGSANATVVSHSHDVTSSGNLNITDPEHTHRLQGYQLGDDEAILRPLGNVVDNDINSAQNAEIESTSISPGVIASATGISISGSTQPAGNPATNANLPPYLGMHPIIKY